jgi:hypothetical protein
MRMNDVKISETPKFLTLNPTDETHAIVLQDPEEEDPYVIPLSLSGVTSSFPTRKPTTADKYENTDRTFDLLYELPDWDSHSPTFVEEEASIID